MLLREIRWKFLRWKPEEVSGKTHEKYRELNRVQKQQRKKKSSESFYIFIIEQTSTVLRVPAGLLCM